MTIKTLVAASLLAGLPMLASAQCMGDNAKADQQAMSCLLGTAWDVDTGLCVPVASS